MSLSLHFCGIRCSIAYAPNGHKVCVGNVLLEVGRDVEFNS
jgi:hypothetical protein